MKFIKRAMTSLAACAVFAGLLPSAQALTVPAGGSDVLSFFEVLSGGVFNKSYSFTLGSGGLFDVDGGISSNQNISALAYKLTGSGGVVLNGSGPGLFSVAGLGSGGYTFNVTGTATRAPGIYSGFAIITSAVPEPATLAMSLAALGLIGGLALRRRSS